VVKKKLKKQSRRGGKAKRWWGHEARVAEADTTTTRWIVMNVTVYKSKDKPFVVYPFFLLLFEQSEICFLFVVVVL
jgi:hypothetical protein